MYHLISLEYFEKRRNQVYDGAAIFEEKTRL